MANRQPGSKGTALHTDFLEIINGHLASAGLAKVVYAHMLGISDSQLAAVLHGRAGVSFQRADYMGRALGLTLRMRADEWP